MVTTEKIIASPAPTQKNESLHPTGHASSSERNDNTPVGPNTESPAPTQKNESLHPTGHASSSERSDNTPVGPKKPSEDGYSWRKYGQKNVKRNEYIRSYYRCSSANCQVKKQVEHAHDGRISDTTYFGEHDHPKPPNNLPITYPSVVSVKVQIADSLSLSLAEDKSSSALSLIPKELDAKDNNKLPIVVASNEGQHEAPPPPEDNSSEIDKLVPKRRKKNIDNAEPRVDKPGNQSTHVVETVSIVDVVNDGYRWRKYGQKLVKGSQHPRSYYRCSNPGCPAKKHVERALRDPRIVITSYEGKHDHDIPPMRTMLPLGSPPSLRTSSEPNGVESSNKPDQSQTLVAKHTETISEKQQDATSHCVAEEKMDAPAGPDVADPIHDSSGPETASSEQKNLDNVALAISCQESDPKERQKPDSEPVRC